MTDPVPEADPERTPPPRRPRPIQPQAGQAYWAVYLAIGHPDEPADQANLERAVELARSLRVATQPGDLGCDVGAHTALDLPDWYESVALYFSTEHDARTFVDMSDFQPFAVLQVTGHEECF